MRAPTGVETGIRSANVDAAAVYADLPARGVDVGEFVALAGVPPIFAVVDQDGNRLEIVVAAA